MALILARNAGIKRRLLVGAGLTPDGALSSLQRLILTRAA
jgi:hypothetical protein